MTRQEIESEAVGSGYYKCARCPNNSFQYDTDDMCWICSECETAQSLIVSHLTYECAMEIY